MKIEIMNPLNTGFYDGSILSPGEGGNAIEYGNYEEDDETLNGYLTRHGLTIEYDYKKYRLDVSTAVNDYFIEKMNEIIYNLFKIKDLLQHKSDELLTSPKYYNFETDKAYFKVIVDDEDYKSFIAQIFDQYFDELTKMIIDRHTSYDGFISFYSNDIEDWKLAQEDLDYNELHTIFSMLLDIGGDREEYLYDLYDICSNIYYSMDWHYLDYADGVKYWFDGRLLKVLQ
ncbi:MAG: hypothetical protein Q8N08_05695 [Methanobacteriaceae archaeon]|nr:hypothetical protein [Methanobacteriaceae archaeon]